MSYPQLPRFVTFTGVDDQTDIDRMVSLSEIYPIEWGILFSGRTGKRYPTIETVKKLIARDLKRSFHFCGKFARWVTEPPPTRYPEIEQMLRDLVTDRIEYDRIEYDRLQINATSYDAAELERILNMAQTTGTETIIQIRADEFPAPIGPLTFLYDRSGGKGVTPKTWPKQSAALPLVGYAGGIGPDNLRDVIQGLDAHAYYLDMETKVRTDDWFDLDKCEAVCEQIWNVAW